MQEEQKEQWTEIISAKSSWFDLRLDELWRYRDLVMLFVWRDFVAVYKQTILGPLWHIITAIVYHDYIYDCFWYGSQNSPQMECLRFYSIWQELQFGIILQVA